jgi:hypothetical protein
MEVWHMERREKGKKVAWLLAMSCNHHVYCMDTVNSKFSM